jgi:hypothetical protein
MMCDEQTVPEFCQSLNAHAHEANMTWQEFPKWPALGSLAC